ncbi:MAG TPA: alpha-L-fucosidase [Planctomycetota bacterium]|nr:alpha-L-fucosidase [Planctomycetota bacterium]
MTDLPPQRIRRFEELGFGLFLHWGLYSQLERGEWTWQHHGADRERYIALARTFTAERFDARAWVALAREAGMTYACLTTRHHEGFSLYDTRGLNDFDAPHAPVGRDLVAEFSAACDQAGIAKFFYHTTLDWWHPDFDSADGWHRYLAYLQSSVEILCRHYGRVDGFWFDGNWARPERDWREGELYGVIRRLQPDAIIVNNSSTGALGREGGHPEIDVATWEQGRPTRRATERGGKRLAIEMCDTVTSHWGVSASDLSAKSPAQIIDALAGCRRHGANLLLNVGPDGQGGVPDYEAAALRLVGRWTRPLEQVLRYAIPTDLACRGDDFVLAHDGSWFYFCANVSIQHNLHLRRGEPGDGLRTIAGSLPRIGRVRWLDEPDTDLDFIQDTLTGMLAFAATPQPYGRQLVWRVARLDGG